MTRASIVAGPVLFARGSDDSQCRVSVLMIVAMADAPRTSHSMSSTSEAAPAVPVVCLPGGEPITPRVIGELSGHRFLVYDLELPVSASCQYEVEGQAYSLMTDLSSDHRIAYVSCNGLEHGDLERPDGERNLMWRRLLQEHREQPFSLLLHGGDQLYADEACVAHPLLQQWSESDLKSRKLIAFSDEAQAAVEDFFVQRYCTLYAQPDVAPLLASVPSLMMWDDHDIFDGWGSHPAELLDSPVAKGVFAVARQAFLLFQRALPVDPSPSLSYRISFPGLEVLAPDLRSERRMDRVLGPCGWQKLQDDLRDIEGAERVILMSSVPLLGPRLSWIERLIPIVPRLRRYEDDLRDQWQSRAHRAEWYRFLKALDPLSLSGSAITIVSGEIHLASRGEMPLGNDGVLHQLIASGIAHPAPPAAWAKGLGWLATLGEDPIQGRHIQLRPLPGQSGIYTAQRNYLVMERCERHWSAQWECEETGRTPTLPLTAAG